MFLQTYKISLIIILNPEPAVKTVLDELDLTNKNIGQFCCNNGRKLSLISKHYNANGVEFDIVENFI
ncbi:hypothetical protein EMELA_v1c03970 [Mesoplasma melaleucae]|uniref:Uncharacterized protein n=1 Tax=Mesoplasma melaleucae TaxID=81459 RepID=A0A2K8NXQ7_9MOLU|nr:hypothetical protein EMELA_v1c03970 [Mesoplasma melaleucae]